MATKEFLLKLTASAYDGDEMSLLCGVYARKWDDTKGVVPDPYNDLTDEGANVPAPNWGRTPLDVIKHVADCKAMYMEQAFGSPSTPRPEPVDTLKSLLRYLDSTHKYVTVCLGALCEDDLQKPLPTQCHGESAANLFRVLAQHDIYNGAYINAIRRVTGK